jgi:hypothetical protein
MTDVNLITTIIVVEIIAMIFYKPITKALYLLNPQVKKKLSYKSVSILVASIFVVNILTMAFILWCITS